MGTFTRAGVTKISLHFQQASRANRWWRSGEARATNEPKVQWGGVRAFVQGVDAGDIQAL